MDVTRDTESSKKKRKHFSAKDPHVHRRNVPKTLTDADLSAPTKKPSGEVGDGKRKGWSCQSGGEG